MPCEAGCPGAGRVHWNARGNRAALLPFRRGEASSVGRQFYWEFGRDGEEGSGAWDPPFVFIAFRFVFLVSGMELGTLQVCEAGGGTTELNLQPPRFVYKA